MEDRTNYNNASLYEIFLNRAFRFDARLSEARLQEFLNLIDAENVKRHIFLKPHNKQAEEMRKRLSKAIEIFLKQPLDKSDKYNLKELLPVIESAYSSDDFIKVVKDGLRYTQKLIG